MDFFFKFSILNYSLKLECVRQQQCQSKEDVPEIKIVV